MQMLKLLRKGGYQLRWLIQMMMTARVKGKRSQDLMRQVPFIKYIRFFQVINTH